MSGAKRQARKTWLDSWVESYDNQINLKWKADDMRLKPKASNSAFLIVGICVCGISNSGLAANNQPANCISEAEITLKANALKRQARQEAAIRITKINQLSQEMHYAKDLYDECITSLGFAYTLAEKVSMSDWFCKTERQQLMAKVNAQFAFSMQTLSASLPILQKGSEIELMREKACHD